MKLPRNLLDRPAEEMARLIALSFLGQVENARDRLTSTDAEALHDFRVGLRRLRTSLRVFRRELGGSVSPRSRNLLARLARATRDSRDLEVHHEWVTVQAESLTPRQRNGATWLLGRLEDEKRKADRQLDRTVRSSFRRVRRRLEKEMRGYHLTVRLDRVPAGQSAAPAMGRQIRQLSGDLESRLIAIHSISQRDVVHAARIRAKRLRYILEPLINRIEGVAGIVDSLRGLQDGLGDLQDAAVYGDQLARARRVAERQQRSRLTTRKGRRAPKAATDGATDDPRAGLVALSRRLGARRAEAFQQLESGWLRTGGEEFFCQVNQLAHILIHGEEESQEIERKYLLRQMPPSAKVAPVLRIEQGWLPGVQINERMRKVTERGEEHRYRTIKAGVGVSRLEVEEEISAPLFDHLWPLTAGRRVVKSRHKIHHGGLTWEIDDFADRELVLAEVEVPSEDTAVEPPEWLKPYVVREVTGEEGFSNLQLAR